EASTRHADLSGAVAVATDFEKLSWNVAAFGCDSSGTIGKPHRVVDRTINAERVVAGDERLRNLIAVAGPIRHFVERPLRVQIELGFVWDDIVGRKVH